MPCSAAAAAALPAPRREGGPTCAGCANRGRPRAAPLTPLTPRLPRPGPPAKRQRGGSRSEGGKLVRRESRAGTGVLGWLERREQRSPKRCRSRAARRFRARGAAAEPDWRRRRRSGRAPRGVCTAAAGAPRRCGAGAGRAEAAGLREFGRANLQNERAKGPFGPPVSCAALNAPRERETRSHLVPESPRCGSRVWLFHMARRSCRITSWFEVKQNPRETPPHLGPVRCGNGRLSPGWAFLRGTAVRQRVPLRIHLPAGRRGRARRVRLGTGSLAVLLFLLWALAKASAFCAPTAARSQPRCWERGAWKQ